MLLRSHIQIRWPLSVWFPDYYNYYYGGGYYHGDGVATDSEGIVLAEGQEATDASEMTAAESTNDTATYMITETATVTEVSVDGGIAAGQPEVRLNTVPPLILFWLTTVRSLVFQNNLYLMRSFP